MKLVRPIRTGLQWFSGVQKSLSKRSQFIHLVLAFYFAVAEHLNLYF